METSIVLPPSIDDVPPPGVAIVEELDKKLLVQLRDGRKIIGILRSFDQFANLVLEGRCSENYSNVSIQVFLPGLDRCIF